MATTRTQVGIIGSGPAGLLLAQLLEKAVAIAPEHAMLRWHLAQVYAELGRKNGAKAQIAAAMADPGFADREAATAVLKTLG